MNSLKQTETFRYMTNEESFLAATAPEEPNRWQPTNDSGAEWCLKKISEKQLEIMQKEQFVKQQIKQLNDWLNRETKTLKDEQAHLEFLLQGYAMKALEGKKKRSISLPSGRFGFRKQPPKIEKDDAALLNYCDHYQSEFIKVKKSVDWAGLKKSCTLDGNHYVTKDGEVLPGVTVTEQDPKFMVEVK